MPNSTDAGLRQRARHRAEAMQGTDWFGDDVVFSVEECWLGHWRGPTILAAGNEGIKLVRDPDARPIAHLNGAILPGFVDSHVHLGLIDATALVPNGIAAVEDLGWDPTIASTWADLPGMPEVRYAGAFLTAGGGYPSDRSWAPDASVEVVPSAQHAAAAVDRQLAFGASHIKLTLNSDAGPVFDDDTLQALVRHAHVRGTRVVAHVQGVGQAARAFVAGVDRLAHAPFSERLDDELLKAMAGPKARTLSGVQSWVSTLDIHGYGQYGQDFQIAQDNVRRFDAFGGNVVYGTDLGNGPLPIGVNERELRAIADAGIDDNGLVRAIATPHLGTTFTYLPGERYGDLPAWLAQAKVMTVAQLFETNFADSHFAGSPE